MRFCDALSLTSPLEDAMLYFKVSILHKFSQVRAVIEPDTTIAKFRSSPNAARSRALLKHGRCPSEPRQMCTRLKIVPCACLGVSCIFWLGHLREAARLDVRVSCTHANEAPRRLHVSVCHSHTFTRYGSEASENHGRDTRVAVTMSF